MLNAKSFIVRDNHIAGIALFGAKATIQGADILKTVPGDKFHFGLLGGGLSIAGCSDVGAKGLRVHDSKSFGVLVDNSKARLGEENVENGDVEIHRNVIGLSVQNVKESFTLVNAQLDQNQGFGIGLSGGSQGIIICKTGVTRTQSKFLPTVGAGAKDVGDGLVWADKSSAMIADLTLSGNALASVLIDGEASGMLSNVTLSDGDEALGIVQQHFTTGAQPMFTAGTPLPQVNAGEVHPVPARPNPVPKNL